MLPKQADSFCAQTEGYGVGQAEGINAVSIWISSGVLVLFAIILLTKWPTLVQFGSLYHPTEKETRPLTCGEKHMGDKPECGRNITVSTLEKIPFITLGVIQIEFFFPFTSQLLEASDYRRICFGEKKIEKKIVFRCYNCRGKLKYQFTVEGSQTMTLSSLELWIILQVF